VQSAAHGTKQTVCFVPEGYNFRVPAPLSVSSKIRVQVPLDRLWDFLADTERVNRAVDLPAIQFSPLPDPQKKGYYRAETTFLGMKLAYDELPFEWVRGRYYQVERRFSSGPLEKVVGGIRCAAAGQATDLEVFADMVPRNLLGTLVAKKVLGKKATEDFIELARAFERHLTQNEPPPALPKASDLHADVLDARLKECDGLLAVPRLREHLLTAPDLEVVRMRPFELADRWGEDRDSVLRLFLHAAKAGVLDLNWSVLCPSCRVPVKQALTLSQLESKAHCETCRVEFGPDLARSIEARFTVNAAVRPARREIYCIGGPANVPQIQSQLRLQPGETRREEFPIPTGGLRVRCYQAPGIVPLQGLSVRVEKDGLKVEAGSPGVLAVENRLDVEALVVVERESWKQGAATAALVTSMQDFRDLFPGEAVAPGEELGIESLAVLFTDLKGSTELYQKLGDAKAFGFVQNHFRYLTEAVALHRGGVVKTMGDAVMAIFASAKDAVQAGVEMQRHWGGFRGERFNTIQRGRMGVGQRPRSEFEGVSLKVGIHQGSAIAINNAGKLDYFGTMVNKAARVQAQSVGDDVVFSLAVAEDAAVRAYLESAGLREEVVTVSLKGLEGDHVLHRIRPT
jgi:class 3 adenylate cyclase